MKSEMFANSVAATTFLCFLVYGTDATSPENDMIARLSLRGKQKGAHFEKERLLMPVEESETRIVGGEQSDENQFPYYVELLGGGGGHYCGGTLIDSKVVLTAAHCNRGFVNQKVLVGGYQAGVAGIYGTESIKVDADAPHPDYDDNTFSNDFLLLRLEDAAEVRSPRASISNNGVRDESSGGVPLTVLGLGDTKKEADGGSSPDFLRDVQVFSVDVDTCNAQYGGDIDSNMFCAAAPGKDSCQGDSGGPIVFEDGDVHELLGVVSWGNGCALANYAGVYAKVGAVIPWIQKVVCDDWAICADFCEDCTRAPTPSPTAPPTFPDGSICDNIPGWYDADGPNYDCEWYASGSSRCSDYGDSYENFGSTANSACCTCGGGVFRESSTPAPTAPPTEPPTPLPTPATPSPTASPTQTPTSSPTKNPTTSPTKSPTPLPTPATPSPTFSPTRSPTSSPTKSPTLSPTKSPTPLPTPATPSPTTNPTTSPTKQPTKGPTTSPTSSPTTPPTEASETCFDIGGWHDADGEQYDCDWYANYENANGESACSIWGDGFENFGYTAKTACCACGGGSDSPIAVDICIDVEGWFDADGEQYDCSWYANTDGACSDYGNDYRNFRYTANKACCACGGGCTGDVPGWKNSNGDGCDWYEADPGRCEWRNKNEGHTSKTACCVCFEEGV